MAKIEELFDAMFDELLTATEKQRTLHTSAFGKQNAQEIIVTAEKNRQKLDCWWGLFQDLKAEMTASGLFADHKKSANKSPKSSIKTTRAISSSNSKPTSVTILGQKKPISYWKDILLFACKTLYEKQPTKFQGLEIEPTLQGRKGPYISTDKSKLRKPEKIVGSPYYVEINLSQTYCLKITYLLLEYFGYTPTDMSIEAKTLSPGAQKKAPADAVIIDSKLKIGQRAKQGFNRLLSENKLTSEELQSLCDQRYSSECFGAYLPVIKLLPSGAASDEERLDKAGRPRYYREVFVTNFGEYLVSSQWYEKQYPQLETYFAIYGV